MLSKIEELALIARCLAMDDRRAFTRLVEATQERLRRFLFNLTAGDPLLTDDLAQETYIHAWRALASFRGSSRFQTWLTSIALRQYYTWVRGNHPTADLDAAPEAACCSSERFDASHDVGVALKALQPLDRSLVLLFYFEDLPVKKISRLTGLTQENVKTRLHRARGQMAKLLTEND